MVVESGSPWEGLAADAAVDRFLELSIPYDMGNAYLATSLASSYGGSLVPPITTRLSALGPDTADADLRRLLLVRAGCRWAYRYREDAYPPLATDAIRQRRRDLLVSLGEAVAALHGTPYRFWLNHLEEDQACLVAIEGVKTIDSSAS